MSATLQQAKSGAPIGRDEALCHVRGLPPLRYLSDPEFSKITASVQLESCATGNELFRAGQDDQFIFYLLSGEISIADAEGECFDVVSGAVESRYPLTPDPRKCVRAIACIPVQYVRLPADLMKAQSEAGPEGITIDEIDHEDQALENRVLFDVYHALMENNLVVPSLPDVAIRIRQVADDDNVGVDDIARIVQADPSTAAYCISIANNAAYSGTGEIDNVLDAVVRMGIVPTRDLVIAYTIRSLFAGNDAQSKKLMREAWKHSCRIAALSYVLARDVARLNPERALLAGLLHDIGITLLINEAQAHPMLLDDINGFNQVCRELSGQVGAMVLRAWKFPDVFAIATLEAENFTNPVAERLQLCDVVMLAHLHDRQPAPWSLETVDLSELAIKNKLNDYDVTDDRRLAVIAQADSELAELTQILSG